MKLETTIFFVLVAVVFGFVALDKVGRWMAARGWIYYRNNKRETTGGGAMAGLLTGFQKLVEPQIEHRQQVMEERNESVGQRLGRGDDIPETPSSRLAESSTK